MFAEAKLLHLNYSPMSLYSAGILLISRLKSGENRRRRGWGKAVDVYRANNAVVTTLFLRISEYRSSGTPERVSCWKNKQDAVSAF